MSQSASRPQGFAASLRSSSLMKALSLPSLFGKGVPKGSEADKITAAEDFDLHIGASAGEPASEAGAAAQASPLKSSLAAPAARQVSPERGLPAPRPAVEKPEYRSAYFNITLAALTAFAFVAVLGLSAMVPALAPAAMHATAAAPVVSALHTVLDNAAIVLGSATAVTTLGGLWELGLFTAKVAWQKPVSDEQFMDFVREEIPSWGLHPSLAANLMGTGPGQDLLKPYRPEGRFDNLIYGFIAGGQIYIRPELVRTPWLFRWVLKHELIHLKSHLDRGPPRYQTSAGQVVRSFFSEFGARIREFGGRASLRAVRLPELERVLLEAKLSLRVANPYDLLIVGPSWKELSLPSAYEKLSGGKAHVEVLPGQSVNQTLAAAGGAGPAAPTLAEFLRQDGNQGRFRFVVLNEAYDHLPAPGTQEESRLKAALQKLDDIYQLERQILKASDDASAEDRRLGELERIAASVGAKPGKVTSKSVDKVIEDMYFQVARKLLAQTAFGQTLDVLYERMHYRGAVILPFSDGDPGLDVLERVLRYWRAPDTGGFAVRRVDLPEGGHALVARRAEPRTELWLKPKGGRTIAASVTNVASGSLDPAQQEKLLRDAGFDDADLVRFRSAGLIIRHVFGADVGENRIFVTVKKAHAKALKRYADRAGIIAQQSSRGYQLHLLVSGPIEKLDGAWKLGLKGEGQKIYDIDTGLDVSHPDFADRQLVAVDFVDDGPEDWVGHGTHKAGISYANGTLYKGMAPKAEGRMGKVFAQSGFGASDGDIMAAAVDAMKWGADVISLSLGSPGTVEAPLAQFFSNLTQQKNANGHHPIVTASAGNSGPFLATKSQPSTGEFVASITAAAKSLDDGKPEVSFYSSVGPGMDQRFSRKRYRRPMGITALGGDVTTPPGVKDVYSQGIESAKSKSMEASPSDTEDGKHTRMSGTSMSNPMVAGIAALVKQAVLRVLAAGTPAWQFFMDELPFAVNMILMRSADDMELPYEFQEGGFVNAEAAVKLGAETFGGSLSAPSSLAGRMASGFLGLFSRQSAPAEAAPAAPAVASYDWIRRAKAVWTLEDKVYQEADKARAAALSSLDKEVQKALEDKEVEPKQRKLAKMVAGNAAGAAFDKRFQEATAEVLPELLKALKDEVWVVRMYAAFALLNIKTPDAAAVQALTDAGRNDPDGRVRRIALLAVGDTGTHATDQALGQASQDKRADVGMYAAYALARHGDPIAVRRIVTETRSQDKKVRHTAIWLLGQLSERAPPEAVDALAERVKDDHERGNLRHLSVASLTYFAVSNPDAVTPQSVSGLLASAGPQNFALTRTISKFFIAASRSAALKARMQEEPLKSEISAFVIKYKQAATKPGALGELVKLLAKIVNIPMDMPTPLPDPTGAGIPGVDPNLGRVHVLVEVPAGGKARIAKFEDYRAGMGALAADAAAKSFGLDAALERFDASLLAAMPVSQSFWVQMPDAKVLAFTQELEAKGYRVRRAAPMFRLLNDTAPLSRMPEVRAAHGGLDGKGVLVAYLDEGGDVENPAFAGRIRAKSNFSGEGPTDEVGPEGVGHGTHGMGITGGTSVDGSPYVGMAPGVEFAVGKVLGASGGSEATVMAGLEWAASLVADPLKTPLLVNLSLGGPGEPDNALGRLVNRLRLKNIGVVVAAGNSGPGEGTVASPANAPLSITVGAVGKDKALADYSSRSLKGQRELSWVDFGGAVFLDRPNLYEIVSLLNHRLVEAMKDAATLVKWKDKPLYQTMSGTSMAAPHSTGKLSVLVERMQQVFKDGLPAGYLFFLEDLVEATAQKMPGHGENEVGSGLIDAPAALAALDEALKDPAKVAARSAELLKAAQDKYGAPTSAPVKPPSRLGRWMKAFSEGSVALGSWLSSMASLFLLK